MNIKQFIKCGRVETLVEPIKDHSCVNIGYYARNGREEETQLNIEQHILTKRGTEELYKLFASIKDELNADPSRIRYISVIASADTAEELEEMGF